MSIAVRPAAASLLVAATVLACSTSASPSAAPSGAPSVTPSQAPASPSIPAGGIEHPTGATDVVLRFDEGGGFVPVEFNAAHLPYFTLYGDGTVVFQQTSAQLEPTADGLYPGYPLRTGKLTEAQVQDLLQFAIGDGGLGIARADYQNPLVADAPTAVFELNADGGSKKVSVVALGMEGEPGPDAAIKASLAKLGDQLKDFDRGGTLSSDPYEPAAYRAVLIDAGGGAANPARDWPWPDLTVDDFAFPADPNQLQQGARVMTPAEIELLGVEGIENGIQSGLTVKGTDGKPYTLVVRPLLPDETA
jgi:hypothetical protein